MCEVQRCEMTYFVWKPGDVEEEEVIVSQVRGPIIEVLECFTKELELDRESSRESFKNFKLDLSGLKSLQVCIIQVDVCQAVNYWSLEKNSQLESQLEVLKPWVWMDLEKAGGAEGWGQTREQ